VKGAAPLFSSLTPDWATPEELRLALDAEFRFDLDVCPLGNALAPLFSSITDFIFARLEVK